MSITVVLKDMVLVVKQWLLFHLVGLLVRLNDGWGWIRLDKSIPWCLKVSTRPPCTCDTQNTKMIISFLDSNENQGALRILKNFRVRRW